MAKRKEDAPPAGSPAWMSTFSDLMNLLLCFFVLLFSMSTMEESKWAELVASMNSTFSVLNGGATAIGDGMLVSNGVSQLNELSEYINSTGMLSDSESPEDKLEEYEKSGDVQILQDALEAQQLKDNEELAEMVAESVAEDRLTDQIDITFTAQYVQLTMKGALLFDSGSAELRQESYDILDKVGTVLERYASGTIEIEGHTDNVPISSREYASNEELSSARALSVFYYLEDNTLLDMSRIRHAGMGERIPIADNSTAEGRSRNRRVEIRIYNPS
ncbi:MAG: flagellar motor protein MotB [Clostridium sp.]|nr:flagellar motor protein MotB [Acetatifactor muris]MCM1526008.1 flagellar motor protein MotB [Bacteroides sp.]MCM1562232.1 flagellar motor protein MotB [Clostridium sp.]